MQGYVARKGPRYYAVIYEGIDPITGRERRRWYPAGKRAEDARNLASQLAAARAVDAPAAAVSPLPCISPSGGCRRSN